MSDKNGKKSYIIEYSVILSVIAVILLILGIIFKDDLNNFLTRLFSGEITKESAKEFMSSFGWHGQVVIAVFSMMQIVLTFLPAEPVQVVAGMSYGLWHGVLICMVGVFVGNNVMYLLSRTLGSKLTGYFRKNINVDLTAGTAVGKVSLAVLILYILPAIPYGLICFMTASTGMKWPRYILLTTLGSLPSVFIGAGLGVIAIETGIIVTLITLAVILIAVIVVICLKNKIFAYINNKLAQKETVYSTAHKVRKPSRFICGTAKIIVGAFVRSKVKLKFDKSFKKLPKPCVVVVNHPSFMDWAYGALAIYPQLGNFIMARYYYFNKHLAWIIKKAGTMPKSMFTTDVESASNAFRVVKNGGILCFMPEARLSSAGKTENMDISGAKMLKLLKLPVYYVHIDGAYLAKPKWGNGYRKGSVIEIKADRLFTAEDIAKSSVEEIFSALNAKIYYNDFDWLKKHPEIHYKSKVLAEGLENILSVCPNCGAEFSLKTKCNAIWCEKCDFSAFLDDRYNFDMSGTEKTFSNLQEWYCDTEQNLKEEIISNPDYALKEKVRLKFPDPTGRKFFVEAGEGECVLNREGFTFIGTVNGEPHILAVPQGKMFRLLFGAGENFEIYSESNYYYFIPPDTRSCVKWYVVSGILHDLYLENK